MVGEAGAGQHVVQLLDRASPTCQHLLHVGVDRLVPACLADLVLGWDALPAQAAGPGGTRGHGIGRRAVEASLGGPGLECKGSCQAAHWQQGHGWWVAPTCTPPFKTSVTKAG